MSVENTIFDRLDKFRLLPKYQLEKRADIFFQMYVEEVFRKQFKDNSIKFVVPEFPLRTLKGDGNQKGSDSSTNVDYLLWSPENKKLYLVELKTEANSFDLDQYRYYQYYSKIKWGELFKFLCQLAVAPRPSSKKYLEAIRQIAEENKLLVGDLVISKSAIKEKLKDEKNFYFEKLSRTAPTTGMIYIAPLGIKESIAAIASKKVINKNSPKDSEVIFNEENLITFTDFQYAMKKDDDFSKRFAKSLIEWNGEGN